MAKRPRRARRSYPDLRTWRKALGLRQVEAAAQLGISQKSYSRFERRQRFARGPLVLRFMSETGVPLEVIVGAA